MAYEFNQAPKELAAQSAAFKKKYGNIESLTDWITQPKYDGVMCIINTSKGEAKSRQGEVMLSVPHLVQAAVDAFGKGWVIYLEVYQWATLHKVINGAARRQRPQPQLVGIVFDAIPESRFEAGSDSTPYHERLADLTIAIQESDVQVLSPVGTYKADFGIMAAALALKNDPANAYDGLILRDPMAGWAPGAAKNGEVIKVKPVLSLDLQVTGQYAEHRPTKLGGYLTVEHNGVPTDVGSGLTQAMLKEIIGTSACDAERVAANYERRPGHGYVGKIAEIECMGITPDGKLREPRFKSFRFDTVAEENKGD